MVTVAVYNKPHPRPKHKKILHKLRQAILLQCKKPNKQTTTKNREREK